MAAPHVAPAVAIDRTRCECIRSLDRLQLWVRRARAIGLCGFDTETTGLSTFRAELVGFSLAIGPGVACYVPVGHHNKDGELLPDQIDLNAALLTIAPLLTDPGVVKVLHNARFDLQVMHRYGIEIAPVEDSMFAAFVDDGGSELKGMDALAKRHLGHECISYDDVTGTGRKRITFDQVPIDKAAMYASEDSDTTLRLWHILRARLQADGLWAVYETLERPLIGVLARMERRGIALDGASLGVLSRDLAARAVQLLAEIRELSGEPALNCASPKQLRAVLFDKLGLPHMTQTESGEWSTAAAVLKDLADAGHALPAKILEWRAVAKLDSTYARALPEAVNPDTGRVHTCLNQAGARTGRLSSSAPNLQNIPIRTNEGRKIRRAFVAPPGRKLISADYSQIELRMLAEIAGIEVLKRAFREGHDIHRATAAEVFGVPIGEVPTEHRSKAKTINFGVIYGIGSERLARQLGTSQAEANAFTRNYFRKFPGIAAFIEDSKRECRHRGYVTTLFGRRCAYPQIRSYDSGQRAFAERQAVNARLQGSAADIIRRAMIRMEDALDAAGLSAQMLLQVHDELLFEAPDDEIEATIPAIKRVMEDAALPDVVLNVPLIVEVRAADNWDEAH
jgi:DNA polymerase I